MNKAFANSRKGSISIIILVAFISITYLSASLPFIPSENYLIFLQFVAYPATCLLLLYRAFIQKDKASGLTRFQQEMRFKTSLRSRLQAQLLVPIALLLAPLIILFLFQWYPAWPSQFIYNDEITLQAKVVKLGSARKVNRTKIYLEDKETGREYNVHWPKEKSQQIFIGSSLKLACKKNWFGCYINSISFSKQ